MIAALYVFSSGKILSEYESAIPAIGRLCPDALKLDKKKLMFYDRDLRKSVEHGNDKIQQ